MARGCFSVAYFTACGAFGYAVAHENSAYFSLSVALSAGLALLLCAATASARSGADCSHPISTDRPDFVVAGILGGLNRFTPNVSLTVGLSIRL